MSKSLSTLHSVLIASGLMMAAVATLCANGQDFFPVRDGPVELVYFGSIKDAKSGRVIKSPAYLTIRDRLTGINIPFVGDEPGHYRSPDIGAAIKYLGEVPDSRQFELSLVVPGYQRVEITKMPRKGSGMIELSFKLQPEGAGPAPQDAVAEAENPGGGSPDHGGVFGQTVAMGVFIAAIALAAIAGVARTLVPRTTTTH